MTKKVIIRYSGKLCPINNKFFISPYPAKLTKRHFLVLTSDYRNAKEELAWVAKSQCPEIAFPKDADLSFTIKFWYPRGVDSDAFIKGSKDSLNGIVYYDDKQVSEDHTKRIIIKGCKIHAEITVEELLGSQTQESLF